MRSGENVLRRGDRWFFRCRVPLRLAAVLGKSELVYALRTSDREMARYLAAAIRVRLSAWWREVEGMADANKTDHVIAEVVRRRFAADLDIAFRQYAAMQAEPGFDAAAQREADENALDVLASDNRDPALRTYLPAALAMLHDAGYPAEATDQQARVLARHMLEYAGLIAEARLRWLGGNEGYRPKLPSLPAELFPRPKTRRERRNEDKRDEPPEPPEPKHKPALVADLVMAWARENTTDPKAIYERQRIADRLCRMVGKDDAALITADDVIRWKGDRLAMISKRTNKPISPVTVIQEINLMSAIWNWSKANRLLAFDANPFSGIAPKVSKRGKQPVRPYTAEEAARVLAFARTCRKPMQRWLPWVLAYTGARLGEVLYSRKQDVRAVQSPVGSDDPIMVLDISPDRERFPKTSWSVRMVPLHPDLIAEGFLDYVASLPDGSALFPSVKPDKFGNLAGTGTKTFGNWIRGRVGITDPRISPAHSLRHLFEDRMHHARPTPDEANALGGHETGGDTSRGGYGNGLRGMPWLTVEVIRRMPPILPRDRV